mmetsp:Transcript_21217/g.43068  ORF Transcript_21217/g.43068 Transcript_21217/m.43068 type:complete len:225 (-) Transcript_21217:917-1591(-)
MSTRPPLWCRWGRWSGVGTSVAWSRCRGSSCSPGTSCSCGRRRRSTPACTGSGAPATARPGSACWGGRGPACPRRDRRSLQRTVRTRTGRRPCSLASRSTCCFLRCSWSVRGTTGRSPPLCRSSLQGTAGSLPPSFPQTPARTHTRQPTKRPPQSRSWQGMRRHSSPLHRRSPWGTACTQWAQCRRSPPHTRTAPAPTTAAETACSSGMAALQRLRRRSGWRGT